MRYRDIVDAYKTEQVETAQQERIRLADHYLWQSIKRGGVHIQIRSQIAEAIGSAIEATEQVVRKMATDIQSDVVGTLASSGISMPAPIDAVSAGPEFKLQSVLEQNADTEETRLAVRMCILNTLYKMVKWDSISQLQTLLNTLDAVDVSYMSHIHSELTMLQVYAGTYQAYIEVDLDTKPNLRYGTRLPDMLAELERLENMGLPITVPNQEGQ